MLEGMLAYLRTAQKLNLDDAWNYAVINSSSISIKIREWIIEQLDEGVNEDNEIIGVYSYMTEQYSNGRKRAGEPYDLDDTGYFRSTITVVPQKLKISVYANGQKIGENILDKYTLKVIGLLEENKDKLREIILNEFLQYVKGSLYNG